MRNWNSNQGHLPFFIFLRNEKNMKKHKWLPLFFVNFYLKVASLNRKIEKCVQDLTTFSCVETELLVSGKKEWWTQRGRIDVVPWHTPLPCNMFCCFLAGCFHWLGMVLDGQAEKWGLHRQKQHLCTLCLKGDSCPSQLGGYGLIAICRPLSLPVGAHCVPVFMMYTFVFYQVTPDHAPHLIEIVQPKINCHARVGSVPET